MGVVGRWEFFFFFDGWQNHLAPLSLPLRSEGGGNKKEKVLNGFLLPAFFHTAWKKRNCLFGKAEFFLGSEFFGRAPQNHTGLHWPTQQFLAVFNSNFDLSIVHLSSRGVNIAIIVVVPDAVADVALPPASWSPLSLVCQCLARPC